MTFKIYFAGSIRGGRDDIEFYKELVAHLSKYGTVLTQHVADQSITEYGEEKDSDEEIYHRDMSWLKESDVMIAEVSTPSLGVGYEICKAEAMNKKILCLFRVQKNKRLSAMIGGNPNLKVVTYETLDEAKRHIDEFLKSYHSLKNQKQF